MIAVETQPITCTLAQGEFKDRLASISALARDALRAHERRDLVFSIFGTLPMKSG